MRIPKKDLRITIARGSGKGGQAVNKTNNAVRIVHLPTGMEAYAHERSQGKSRKVAMELLEQKLADAAAADAAAARKADRDRKVKDTVRVRTYDQTSNRVTDSRSKIKRGFDDVVKRGRIQDILEDRLR